MRLVKTHFVRKPETAEVLLFPECRCYRPGTIFLMTWYWRNVTCGNCLRTRRGRAEALRRQGR